MCKQNALEHTQQGSIIRWAWMHREKICVRVHTDTHSYLRQSGGKEELFILYFHKRADAWEPIQKHYT